MCLRSDFLPRLVLEIQSCLIYMFHFKLAHVFAHRCYIILQKVFAHRCYIIFKIGKRLSFSYSSLLLISIFFSLFFLSEAES